MSSLPAPLLDLSASSADPQTGDVSESAPKLPETPADGKSEKGQTSAPVEGSGNPFSTAAQSTSKFFSSFGWGSTKPDEGSTAKKGTETAESSKSSSGTSSESTAEKLKKQAMENMLRDIAKQEADRRMAEHVKNMDKMKKERDSYKEQLVMVDRACWESSKGY